MRLPEGDARVGAESGAKHARLFCPGAPGTPSRALGVDPGPARCTLGAVVRPRAGRGAEAA